MNTALLKNHYHEEMRDRAAKGLRHMNYVDWKDQKALLAIYFEMKHSKTISAPNSTSVRTRDYRKHYYCCQYFSNPNSMITSSTISIATSMAASSAPLPVGRHTIFSHHLPFRFRRIAVRRHLLRLCHRN